MEFCVDGFETIPGDVCVDLRRGNIGVAKKLLDNTQVGPTLKEMRRKGMAECVGRDVLGNAGKPRIFFDHLPHELPRQPLSVPAQEEMIRLGLQLGTDPAQISLASRDRDAPYRHKPLLIALPATLDELIIQIYVIHRELRELGDPHPGGIKTLQKRQIANPPGFFYVRNFEKRVHLLRGQKVRQFFPRLWGFKNNSHILNLFLSGQKTVKKFN